jgi:cysteine desulfurase
VLANRGLELLPPHSHADLISVMTVNNEIGARWDPAQVRESATWLHSDITQQAGKLEASVAGLDFASLSGHKFYGPKGVGALYIRDEPPTPLLLGGEQEAGRRAGTLNVAGIVGLGAAAAIAMQEISQDEALAREMKEIVVEELKEVHPLIHGGPDASPYILSVSFRGVEGETLLVDADRAGFAISAGAACSSRSTEPSHVLRALDLGEEWTRGTVRISCGRFNTKDSARELGQFLTDAVRRLGSM